MRDYQQLKIQKFENWSLFLHENQYYLGRSYLWAHREEDFDIFEMNSKEKDEFFDIGKKVKRAILECFNPDRFNYANLQNEANHLHLHIIPRYKTQRLFDGLLFSDENYGKNYAPYDKNFKVNDGILFKIRDEIKSKLR